MLRLAVALDQQSAYDADSYVALARLAERGGFDFVTLDDPFARPGPDALAVLSRVAPATSRIGLVPTVATTHTQPFHVEAAVATLDWVSRGRAGWRLDAPTGRFIDRDRLHHGDFRGTSFSVEGPSIVPRPPQGHPVRVVDATDGQARRTAARYADVALVRAVGAGQAAGVRAQLRSQAAEYGRDPGQLKVLASLLVDLGAGEHAAEPGHGGGGPRQSPQGPLYRGGPVDLAELIAGWHDEGVVDGFHLVPTEPLRDLERLVNGTVALLRHRGLFRTFYPGSTLREHLGLARPANRYAVTGGTS
ncbi:LLM class flavin-dependent oxidoreductase [Streptomyces griseorubiginosus]|uniref:LLM class flavin-dependent oxidoreductase n=1 Tax=Streptomyces griseorubiginosus TaxID=67304 RepID=UPI00113FEA85|nr:LLM class flavin-dependent oxidoreductase [Streptomyces griseorubiginosus]